MLDLECKAEDRKDYQTYVMGNKLFIFDLDVQFEVYENPSYYGIIFIVPGEGNGIFHDHGRYDVVHHHLSDWERLIINCKHGHKDVPFHSGTFGMLPKGIKVLEL